jgi:sulfotransferase family protein
MVTVLYIGGLGRSGSTLVERLAGQLPGACAVGEIVHLWQRGITEGERCGCGAAFGQCPFWQRAGKTAFGGWHELDVGRFAALRAQVDRNRFIPRLAARPAWVGPDPALAEYLSYYARLYAAVAEVSGAGLVIDSSKHPSLAHCLRWAPGVDLRVVHLVRDSRAVAYSWGRQVRRPDTDRESYMTRYSPAVAAVQWNGQNAAFYLLARLGCPVMRLKYEDFVAAPRAALDRIAAFAGLPAGSGFAFLGTGAGGWSAELELGHSVSGNPMRFATGKVAISRDERWRADMPAGQRRAVTALTLPLLAGYGYYRARS